LGGGRIMLGIQERDYRVTTRDQHLMSNGKVKIRKNIKKNKQKIEKKKQKLRKNVRGKAKHINRAKNT
jgi:hypothetical protein